MIILINTVVNSLLSLKCMIDAGFMCSPGYIAMVDVNPYIELLPVAPLHEHPKAGSRPVYFTEIIILKDNA